MSDNKRISIPKQEDPFSYIVSLFRILREEASDRDWIYEGNQLKWIPKEPNVIHLDYEDLRIKILNWMTDKKNVSNLDLNDEESSLLKKCSYAAYYFVTEDDYPEQKRPERFIKFHETYFR